VRAAVEPRRVRQPWQRPHRGGATDENDQPGLRSRPGTRDDALGGTVTTDGDTSRHQGRADNGQAQRHDVAGVLPWPDDDQARVERHQGTPGRARRRAEATGRDERSRTDGRARRRHGEGQPAVARQHHDQRRQSHHDGGRVLARHEAGEEAGRHHHAGRHQNEVDPTPIPCRPSSPDRAERAAAVAHAPDHQRGGHGEEHDLDPYRAAYLADRRGHHRGGHDRDVPGKPEQLPRPDSRGQAAHGEAATIGRDGEAGQLRAHRLGPVTAERG
jgi:hypothetical protein